ncbi:unnamed protein product [Cercopithifilaria johnstoni]|uniref:Domain of unknown function DB domain-containing protein n=1 Tax=Cercopithifilaria johnstoni TaxID=2874296 RepID=A0A8J2Q9M3_9BILA|nr:unnamed protein product [Cercopithifilaria johnstoni]
MEILTAKFYWKQERPTIRQAPLHQDQCPMSAMKEMHFCAAQGRDHRPCCLRSGITTTLAGAKCLTFCDQRPGK